MPDYRVYIIGHDGHFQASTALPNCPNDDAAIAAAQPLVDGHDVELWHLDRMVAVFDHRTKIIEKVIGLYGAPEDVLTPTNDRREPGTNEAQWSCK